LWSLLFIRGVVIDLVAQRLQVLSQDILFGSGW
jgi:hypothetical protein